MTRGNAEYTKVLYKGKSETFNVLVDSPAELNKWRKDENSVPLAEVVNGWKIFTSHKQGGTGLMDEASKASLENEFGTKNQDEWFKKILREGEAQTKTNSERMGDTNVANGSGASAN